MPSISVIAISLFLVALLTAALGVASILFAVDHVTIIYLIPVLYAAIRGGVVPAIVAALAGLGAAAFFFYPPNFDFRVTDPAHIVDLVLFIIVAVITGQLGASVRQAKMREQSEILREAFIGSVSHELRTPLSSILGSASVLAQSPEITSNPRLCDLVRVMREEADHLNGDIQNLLDATRITSEGIRPRPELVDPGDIVNSAIERKSLLLTTHALKLNVAQELPFIQVDGALIEKALGQLIENAVKYSPTGSPIEITADRSNGEIKVSINDHGNGIASAEQEKIWERFYRSPRHRDRVAGSGLGLWIARSLVTACGGRIAINSNGIDHGTTASIFLPIEQHASAYQMEGSDE